MRTLKKPAQGDLTPKPRKDGTPPAWSRKGKKVAAFVTWALGSQQHQCAFCGFDVGNALRRAWSVDHFAPKGENLYPQWTFEPLNLVITCHVCNSVFKNEYDSVASKATNYVDCEFFLVHPYLDTVHHHLLDTYAGGSEEVGAPRWISDKGRKTIEKFHLDDPDYLVAINNQALLISLAEWKKSISISDRDLFHGALKEVTGRR